MALKPVPGSVRGMGCMGQWNGAPLTGSIWPVLVGNLPPGSPPPQSPGGGRIAASLQAALLQYGLSSGHGYTWEWMKYWTLASPQYADLRHACQWGGRVRREFLWCIQEPGAGLQRALCVIVQLRVRVIRLVVVGQDDALDPLDRLVAVGAGSDHPYRTVVGRRMI